MGKLYRVKIIHTLTGFFSGFLFLLQLKRVHPFSFPIENFYSGFQMLIPCLGLITSLLFIFFKRTFMLPALLVGATLLQVAVTPQDYHFLFLLVILIILTPYVVYFYKYRDFEIMLSGIKIIIPVSILLLWYIQIDILELLYSNLGIAFIASGITFLFFSLWKKTSIVATYCFVLLCVLNCTLMYGLKEYKDAVLQLFLLTNGFISYNMGKSPIFEKASFHRVAKSPRAVILSAVTITLTLYLQEYEVSTFFDNAQAGKAAIGLFENVTLCLF